MLKLVYAPHTCALASHIALEEAGAGYEAVRAGFKKNAQRASEYLAVNPKGLVPSLATDLGILTGTPAILAFIAQSYTKARLAPLEDWLAYTQQEFDIGEVPGLVGLGEGCHPPFGCECWIAWGPALDRGIDKDGDRHWHAPRSVLFPPSRPEYFVIVHLRRMDADAYSVLGCDMDLRR